MSNARNLADLLSPGNTIVAADKLAGVEDKIILNGTDGSSTNADSNTWTPVNADSNTWTEQNSGNNTWQLQG